MEYRREIDGLRALAVLPVILFHAGFQAFGGGFVGVDVFFVISGYLITALILGERQAGTFSFADFYERRARRILPALFLVMAVCVALAWLYLLPAEMKAFGQGISAAAAFLANVFFTVKNHDYFGLQTDGNPLLHLWSLAVEEQFYLFFPLFLALTGRFGRQRLAWLLAAALLASLAAAQWGSANRPTAAFFLLPTRGWELLTGAFLAVWSSGRETENRRPAVDQSLSLVGLLLTTFAIFAFDTRTPSPSLHTLMPTLGAALMIAFATPRTLVGRLLGSKLLVGIGLVSYSAYLWHQPLFAFNRIVSYEEPGWISFLYLSALSLALAYVTWRFVERPLRARHRFGRRAVFAASAAVSLGFIAFGVVGHYNSGYPDRNPLYQRLVGNFGLSLSCNGNTSINAVCATSAEPEVAVWGNSYAMHLVEGLGAAYPGKSFVQLTQDSCAPHANLEIRKAGKLDCSEFFRRALATIVDTPSIKLVLISSPFRDLGDGGNAAALEETLQRLKAAGKRTIVVGPPPSSGIDFGKCFVRHADDFGACNFARGNIERRQVEIVARLRDVAARGGAEFLDLADAICVGAVCRAAFGGTLIYRDAGHLSREGSRYLFLGLRQAGALRL